MSTPVKPFTLTDEERELVTNNHKLIYSYLNKFHLSNEYYDLCAIGLCRAAHFYKPENGKFSVFAFACMSNTIRMEWRKVQRQVQTTVSLNSTICNEEPVPIPIECTIPDPQDDYAASDIYTHIHYICRDDPVFLRIAHLHIQGYSAVAISRMTNTKVVTVRRRIKRLKQELQESLKNL